MYYEDVQNQSRGDFFCELCECFANGIQSFDNHLNGHRHAKNIKKWDRGELVTKVVEPQAEGRRAHLFSLLGDSDEPVIGLNSITEIHRWDSTISFNCAACEGSFTPNTVVGHILSTKHRINIIGKNDLVLSARMRGVKLTKESHEAIVFDRAMEFQHEYGSERPLVTFHRTCLNWRDLDYPQDDAPPDTAPYPAIEAPGLYIAAPDKSTATIATISSDEDETEGGITDIDLERDSDMISTDMKLEILESMIDGIKIRPNDDTLARGYVDLLKTFSFLKLQHIIRQLSPVRFNELVKNLEHEDSMTFNEYVEKKSFMYISPGTMFS